VTGPVVPAVRCSSCSSHQPRPGAAGVKLPSDRVVAQVARAGGLAAVEAVRRTVAQAIGPDKARLGIGLAVIAGRVERVRLLDGSDGLRLREPDRTPW